jgi:hypothetical protein
VLVGSSRQLTRPSWICSWSQRLNKENHDALTRLLFCLPHFNLPTYPDTPKECYENEATVILTAFWFADMARLDDGESAPGEVVFLK